MGPCVPPAHMINPSNVDASGYRMFQLNELMPALFGTRGGGGVRIGPSSSNAARIRRRPRCGVRAVRRYRTRCPLRTSESTRARERAKRVTESAAVAESCLLVKERMSLPFASMNSSTTSRFGCLSQ